jgi:hypothetical protein
MKSIFTTVKKYLSRMFEVKEETDDGTGNKVNLILGVGILILVGSFYPQIKKVFFHHGNSDLDKYFNN